MVRRGELWWVDFAEPVGSAPGYRRPAAVVSADRFNRSRIATVIVAAVTSKLDELADELDAGAGSGVGRRLIDTGAWQW